MLTRFIRKADFLAGGFAKRLQKKSKERNYGVAVSDEKMVKLTTKEEGKEAEKSRVGTG